VNCVAGPTALSSASLNWREIDLVLAELELEGLFVRDITQPDAHTLHIEVAGHGRSHRLLVRLAPPYVRLHATSRRAGGGGSGKAPKRFAAFLRAHIRGGRIAQAAQLGRERIVRLAIHRRDAQSVLWLRLWSNAANAILTDPDGRILDTFYRRPKRGELTGRAFALPGPGKADREFAIRELPGEGSFNERLDRTSGETERSAASQAAFEGTLRELEALEGHLATREQTLGRQIAENEGYGSLKEQGDLILANLRGATKGDHWLDLADRRIELDVTLTPSANAQAYYSRFKRARAAVTRLQGELGETREKLSRAREALAALTAAADAASGATGAPALERMLRELGITAAGPRKQRAAERPPKVVPPGLRFHSGPFTILVGRSATENDELLRRHVRGNDTWFHCRDFPGAYVFVRALPGKSVPLEVMLDAANLAVHYSKGKASGAADVYYTAVKYLRRPRDGPIGLVLPTMERNLRVRHEQERIDRLKRSE
jgi:predicted ribosome quality control (RQC) complex YloA/Tae2 family protein